MGTGFFLTREVNFARQRNFFLLWCFLVFFFGVLGVFVVLGGCWGVSVLFVFLCVCFFARLREKNVFSVVFFGAGMSKTGISRSAGSQEEFSTAGAPGLCIGALYYVSFFSGSARQRGSTSMWQGGSGEHPEDKAGGGRDATARRGPRPPKNATSTGLLQDRRSAVVAARAHEPAAGWGVEARST